MSKRPLIYQFIFAVGIFCISCSSLLAVNTLYLINVAVSSDAKLGSGFTRNALLVEETLAEVASQLDYCYEPILLNGMVKPENIRLAIDSLSVDDTDIVFFYYSGHGCNEGSNPWPSLMVPGTVANMLNLECDIHLPLLEKKPLLVITAADCCNHYLRTASKHCSSTDLEVLPPAAADFLGLFQQRGDIIISATTEGQFGLTISGIGGLFTSSFVDVMKKYSSPAYYPCTWSDVFDDAAQKTQKYASEYHNPQQPQFRIRVQQGED